MKKQDFIDSLRVLENCLKQGKNNKVVFDFDYIKTLDNLPDDYLNNPSYKFLSRLIHESEYAEDTAYQWLWDGMTTLREIIEYADIEEVEEDVTTELSDEIREYLPEYVYTSDHTEFLSKNSWALDEYIQEMGAGDDGNLMACYAYHQEKGTLNFIDELVDYLLS